MLEGIIGGLAVVIGGGLTIEVFSFWCMRCSH